MSRLKTIPMIEQETIITIGRLQDWADICTSNRTTARRLNKLCERYPDDYQYERRTEDFIWYRVRTRNIRFGKPRKRQEGKIVAGCAETSMIKAQSI